MVVNMLSLQFLYADQIHTINERIKKELCMLKGESKKVLCAMKQCNR